MSETRILNNVKGGDKLTLTYGEEKIDFTVPPGQNQLVLQSQDPSIARVWTSDYWNYLELAAWAIALTIIAGFAIAILFKIFRNTINLKELISEPDGKASLSRFQALIFTFVFVIALALIVLRTGRFPTDVPLGVWALLAGSLGTYLISKGMERGLGAGGGGPAGFEPGGPMTRYGENLNVLMPGISEEDAAQKRQASAVESRFLVPAGNNAFGTSVNIASAVSRVKLTISAQPLPGVEVKGRVRYRAADGEKAPEFSGETTIETDPNSVSDVRVEFSANAPNTVVPVRVKPTV